MGEIQGMIHSEEIPASYESVKPKNYVFLKYDGGTDIG